MIAIIIIAVITIAIIIIAVIIAIIIIIVVIVVVISMCLQAVFDEWNAGRGVDILYDGTVAKRKDARGDYYYYLCCYCYY